MRWIWVGLAGATAAEGAWGLTYLTADEAGPYIWLVPLLAFAAGVVAFAIATRETERTSTLG